MTEPKETAPGTGTEADAARAEAEAMAMAADELGAEDETAGVADAADETQAIPVEGAADEVEGDEIAPPAPVAATVLPGRSRAERDTRAARPAERPVLDPSVRVSDRASSIFVIATVAIFGLLFLNAMLLGTGGTFTPYVSPTPEPTPSLAPSASIVPSPSIAPSGSPAASSSVAPSVAPSGSVGPSSSAPPASASPAPS